MTLYVNRRILAGVISSFFLYFGPEKASLCCAPIYLTSQFATRRQISDRITRNSQQLNIPLFKTAAGQRSFHYRVKKLMEFISQRLKAMSKPRILQVKDVERVFKTKIVLYVLLTENPFWGCSIKLPSPLPLPRWTQIDFKHLKRLWNLVIGEMFGSFGVMPVENLVFKSFNISGWQKRC